MTKRKRKLPHWMRKKVSCPNCGLIFRDGDELEKAYTHILKGWNIKEVCFDCPRCKIHYTHDDFWEEQYFKWGIQR